MSRWLTKIARWENERARNSAKPEELPSPKQLGLLLQIMGCLVGQEPSDIRMRWGTLMIEFTSPRPLRIELLPDKPEHDYDEHVIEYPDESVSWPNGCSDTRKERFKPTPDGERNMLHVLWSLG